MIQDSIVSIYRLVETTQDSDRERYEIAIPNVRMNIQPVDPNFQVALGDGSIGRYFNGFTTATGIQSAMLLTVSGSTTTSGYKYLVTGVDDWRLPNMLPHYELTLTKLDE